MTAPQKASAHIVRAIAQVFGTSSNMARGPSATNTYGSYSKSNGIRGSVQTDHPIRINVYTLLAGPENNNGQTAVIIEFMLAKKISGKIRLTNPITLSSYDD